ncbi:hypothetical protein ElyMa_003316800 [Elysia marginata]|uniref:Uncharacterized protein n=1 Tax=Elysia marginata TaxID=1093978 RepID=A0AAV4JE29_9GAST|nr:hypothetical protein ElyMa_003316800 [Elysia marginata]
MLVLTTCTVMPIYWLVLSVPDEAVREIEKNLKESEQRKLGRDELKAYSTFASAPETSACRLIRTAAECVGPRGDEKSGSRAEWLAYCECDKQGTKSKFTSFGANRFNNLFENAAAVPYHRQHLLDFLEIHCTHSNLKVSQQI